jgi:hypothetical protein
MNEQAMVRRRDAAQATLDRFRDKPLRYSVDDCARMAAFHARKLGHQVKLPPSGSYRTAAGALKQMLRLGYADLEQAVDAHGFERIAPAAAAVGDLVMMPGDAGLHSLAVCLGNGRTIGWHVDAPGATILQPIEFVAAWRVEPQD